jgi:hypothetical protein
MRGFAPKGWPIVLEHLHQWTMGVYGDKKTAAHAAVFPDRRISVSVAIAIVVLDLARTHVAAIVITRIYI